MLLFAKSKSGSHTRLFAFVILSSNVGRLSCRLSEHGSTSNLVDVLPPSGSCCLACHIVHNELVIFLGHDQLSSCRRVKSASATRQTAEGRLGSPLRKTARFWLGGTRSHSGWKAARSVTASSRSSMLADGADQTLLPVSAINSLQALGRALGQLQITQQKQ